jgi:shikimate dehydrogenase
MGVPYAEVIGDPIAHSKSPLIHKFWLGKLGLEGDYRQVRVKPDELEAYLASRREDRDWCGCNVTMPHKSTVGSFVEADPPARRIGAINTIARVGNLLVGLNTDWIGLNLALGPHSADGRDVVLIGAGGAARAAMEELRMAKPRSLVVMNRDTGKVARLLTDFQLYGEARPIGAAPAADLLINASALGMEGYPPLDIDLSALRSGAAVLDMVYHPLETRLLHQARSRGLTAIDGLEMLIDQAAMAFQFFFHVTAPEPFNGPELRELLTR